MSTPIPENEGPLNPGEVLTGFDQLAARFGIPSEQTGGRKPSDGSSSEESVQERYLRLWRDAANPEMYSGLHTHSFLASDGSPKVIPETAVSLAREAAELFVDIRSGQKRNRNLEEVAERVQVLLAGLGVSEERFTIEQETLELDAKSLSDFPQLPSGYGFKGGVARKALARALELNMFTGQVRDIDLIRDGNFSGEQDQKLAEFFMVDDLVHANHGVEVIYSRRKHLESRELTMNQVYYIDGKVGVTLLGLLDSIGGVIRVTDSQKRRNRGKVHPIVAFKALRFAAALEHEDREHLIQPFRVSAHPTPHPFAFYLGLHLSRAYEAETAQAESFIDLCEQWGLTKRAGLPASISAKEAAARIQKKLRGVHFGFPSDVA